uniref:Esterase lipase n=1 Tax=uncultured microorganism TaxID=358574 RepID=A0A0B4ZTW9_9ZZZZ|nr:esterase lipase [uncultured microorganism]
MTILYIHGGAYIAGVTRTYHNLAGKLASALQAEVLLPRYPFAPEHPFPHAINAMDDAYRFLLARGTAPENIVIAGDSAGGGLTLALLLSIRDSGLPTPRCAVVFSPGANSTDDAPQLDALSRTDVMLSASMIRNVIKVYIPNTADRTHPYASPALGDYTGLPPLMITVATDECLYDDALRVRARAEAAGVPVTWLERTGLFHVWPVMVPFLPEARQDIEKVIAFIRHNVAEVKK